MVWLFVFCIEAPIDSLPSEGIRTRWSFQDTCGQSGGSQGFFYCIAMACSRQKEDGSQPVDASEIRRINHWMVQKPCTLWDFNYLKKNHLFLNWWVFLGGFLVAINDMCCAFGNKVEQREGHRLKGGWKAASQVRLREQVLIPTIFPVILWYFLSM